MGRLKTTGSPAHDGEGGKKYKDDLDFIAIGGDVRSMQRFNQYTIRQGRSKRAPILYFDKFQVVIYQH